MKTERTPAAPRRPPPTPRWRSPRNLVVGLVTVGAVGLVIAVILSGFASTVGGATVWATLGTRDVHSLAFDPSNAQHIYFGHHNGLLESRDGGRGWQPTGLGGADAMNVRPAADGALQIAGHNVYQETANGGQSWAASRTTCPASISTLS